MTLAPWDYLFEPFSARLFPDLFHPTWIASLILLVALVVLYNVRTRQLRRYPPFLDLYEWLLWTGIIVFGLLIVYAIFVFDFIFVIGTIVIGLGTLAWIRFYRFPPIIAAYERALAKQRYVSRQKFARPEATIRSKSGGKASRRRRRR